MVKVGIVILNWNGYEDTVECIKSISKVILKGINLQVLVVDNASVDDSVRKLKKLIPKYKAINLQLLVNNDNLGFAGGNNSGMEHFLKKDTEHVLILNNDTVVEEHFLVELIKFAKAKPKYGVLSPKIYFAKGFEFHKDRYKKSELGKVIWAAGGEMDWNNVFGKNRGVDEVDKGQFNKVVEIDFATGAAMLVNVKLLKKIGTFDDNYFMYFEDADFVKKATSSSFKSYYVPEAIVWHKVAQSSAIGGQLNDYFITRNRLLFGIKYAPNKSKAALLRESVKMILSGRKWQKIGVRDFYLRRFGKGSWK